MRYTQLGEQNGIGATAHCLEFSDSTVAVVDFGIAIEKDPYRNLVHPPANAKYLHEKQLRFIFVTHTHLDHIGAIPRLVNQHPESEVFMSQKTFELGRIMLADSLKISKREARHQRYEDDLGGSFTEFEFENFLNSPMLRILDEPQWFSYPDGWRVGMSWAGHIAGAMSVFLQPPCDNPVMVTGDRSSINQRTVRGVVLPPKSFINGFCFSDATVIMECTNGNRKVPSREITEQEIINFAHEVIERDGVLLVPSFAVNRSAELSLILTDAGLTVHVDGLARKILEVEIGSEKLFQLKKSGKIVILEDDETGRRHRQNLIHHCDRCANHSVIIAPSAMMDKGYSAMYAERILQDRNNGVLMPGYLFPDSPAYNIMNKLLCGGNVSLIRRLRSGKTFVAQVPVRCEIRHFDLSAHDDKNGLMALLLATTPRNIILHHIGDGGANPILNEILQLKLSAKTQIGTHGKTLKI